MLTHLIVLTLALAVPSPHHRFGLTEAMPAPEGTIRLASYNMLNYFDQENDPSLEGEYDDFGSNPGPTSRQRCETMAAAIRAIDADILAVQEVESEAALKWFRDQYLADMGYDYIVSKDVGYYRGIEQGLLSRFPITASQIWPAQRLSPAGPTTEGWDEIPADVNSRDMTFQRSPLFATVRTPDGYELSLFIVHHKAGRNRWLREAEAVQIMKFVNELITRNADANIAVVGDFNAQPWDRSMQAYFRGGMIDAHTLRTTNLEQGDTSPLRKTHTSNRLIDFILLNHAATGELVPNSGFVLGTSAEEYDWMQQDPPAGYASDHYPIVVDFVPREGAGATVEAMAWPAGAMATALAASRQKPPKQSPSATRPTAKPVGNVTGEFLASKRSKVFHNASCKNAQRISEKNRVAYSSTGEAIAAGKRPAKCCQPGGTASSGEPQAQPPAQPQPVGDVPGEFVASKSSKVFHKADCQTAKRISEKNRMDYASTGEALAEGKRPAKCCNPGS